jgi:hypothetical protein
MAIRWSYFKVEGKLNAGSLNVGSLARLLHKLLRDGDIESIAQYTTALTDTDKSRLHDAIKIEGALEGFFTVSSIEEGDVTAFTHLQDAIDAWRDAGSPSPKRSFVTERRWDGKSWRTFNTTSLANS